MKTLSKLAAVWSVEGGVAKATETRQDSRVSSRAYHAPELHVVGKATDLVQGGSGITFRDAYSRYRYG